MNTEDIVESDAEAERVSELMESTEIEVGGQLTNLGAVVGDIQTAHKELDEYKNGSLSLAQSLSELADQEDDDVLSDILTDMSNGAFAVYLRLHRGDLELMGGREGKHSGFLKD